MLSLARLDRFYGFKHQLSLFRSCSIIPDGFSDRSLVFWSLSLRSVKLKSAYWHFNTNFLSDHFREDTFGMILEPENHLFSHYNNGGILLRYK